MATTKIWPIRDSLKRVLDYAENPDKTGYLDLRRVLEYTEDGSKTYVDDEFEDRYFISGVNCNVETAFEEMTAVKQRFGISREELKSTKRNSEIAIARHYAIYVIRKTTNLSQKAIAKLFNRDHTTIINSLTFIEKKMKKEPLFEREINQLIFELQN